jgi:hypothetical protein
MVSKAWIKAQLGKNDILMTTEFSNGFLSYPILSNDILESYMRNYKVKTVLMNLSHH